LLLPLVMGERATDDEIYEHALTAWNEKYPDRALTIDLCRLRWETDTRGIVDYLDGKVIGHAFVDVAGDRQVALSGPYDSAPPR
jgi:hypothetical protein